MKAALSLSEVHSLPPVLMAAALSSGVEDEAPFLVPALLEVAELEEGAGVKNEFTVEEPEVVGAVDLGHGPVSIQDMAERGSIEVLEEV